MLEDTNQYSTTNGDFTTLRTLNFAVPISGKRLIFVKFEFWNSSETAYSFWRIWKSGQSYNGWEMIKHITNETTGHANITVPIVIQDGESWSIQGATSDTAYIKNIYVFGGGYGTTCVGS